MKLFGKEKSFELHVAGYQYSEYENYYDANWLTVRIKAHDEKYAWEAEDPCMLSYELASLKDWFCEILKGKSSELIDFMEGELGFKYNNETEILSIILNFKFHPKGDGYIYGDYGDSAYAIDFEVNEKQINGLIHSLDLMINKYPVRE